MKKNMNKTTKNNFITYGMVIAIFVVVQILSSTGNLSRLLTGLLVPICVYRISFPESGSRLFRRAESWTRRIYVRWSLFQCSVFPCYQ